MHHSVHCDVCWNTSPPVLVEIVLKSEPGQGLWCGWSLGRGSQEARRWRRRKADYTCNNWGSVLLGVLQRTMWNALQISLQRMAAGVLICQLLPPLVEELSQELCPCISRLSEILWLQKMPQGKKLRAAAVLEVGMVETVCTRTLLQGGSWNQRWAEWTAPGHQRVCFTTVKMVGGQGKKWHEEQAGQSVSSWMRRRMGGVANVCVWGGVN